MEHTTNTYIKLPPMVKLNRIFDPEKLKKDLQEVLKNTVPVPHLSKLHDGGWTGISLRNSSGRNEDGFGLNRGHYENTPAFACCPNLMRIVDEFPAQVGIARLLFLSSEAKVAEHTDSTHHWQTGLVRLHIPIITHEDVHMKIGGERANWREGELWFGDFSQPHSLHNASPIDRIHFVFDANINSDLLSLFPDSFVDKIRESTSILLNKSTIKVSNQDLERVSGFFWAPKQSLPIKLPVPLACKIEPYKDKLHIKIIGLSQGIFVSPVTNDLFSHLNHEISFSEEASGIISANIKIPEVYVIDKEINDHSKISEFQTFIKKRPSLIFTTYSAIQYCLIKLGIKLILTSNKLRRGLPGKQKS